MNSYLIVRTRTLNYMSQNQTEFGASYETPLRFFAIYVTVQCVYRGTNVCWKVARCIWATGGRGELGCHRNGIGRMVGRVFFMTAFMRRRAWRQGFIVRCRYWISIAGQGIWRANGHHSTTVLGAERICFRPKMDSTWANVARSARTNSANESWYSRYLAVYFADWPCCDLCGWYWWCWCSC